MTKKSIEKSTKISAEISTKISIENPQKNSLNIATLGQVFTPQSIVELMLSLVKNNGRFLEPSCGDGAFFKNLPNQKVGIELDSSVINDKNILNMDFFAYPINEKFDTIIGNPPYVRYQDIQKETKNLLFDYKNIFDERSNLYLFFIYKSLLHLREKGELIFITPRDFLKSTASMRLNEFLFSLGTITDIIELGDKKIFSKAQPNCIIWRFEKGNFKRNTNISKQFSCVNGQILFTKNHYFIPFSTLFFVKVGAVSGADEVFRNEKLGNVDFVCSHTAKNGKTRKMIYGEAAKELLSDKKARLLARKIKKFGENNWWHWGRDYHKSDLPRIYVNTKTRNKKPFFMHSCKAYDGSILAIFPKFSKDLHALEKACERLNNIDWQELGFVCDGRFLFSQKSLENCLLDESFKEFL